jgi:ABC-2 type transport system ATP-binding protein
VSLVGAPTLLLLDEPTAGLDPAARAEVWAAVRSLVAAGTDVLLTTHYLEEADELADQVVIIDHGRSIATGTPAELKSHIGRDVIDIAVRYADQVATAAGVLEAVTSSPTLIDQSRRRLQSHAEHGTTEVSAVIAALARAHVEIDEIALRHPTLDEVFLNLTGEHPHQVLPVSLKVGTS